MNIAERLAALRSLMDRYQWDAVIISGTDPHGSEYLPERWQQRKWISGFTGSYGIVVVTRDHAGLWTDTRYFIQVKKELEGTGIELHKLRVPDAMNYPEWLASVLPAGSVTGIDGLCMSVNDVRHLESLLAKKGCRIDNKPSFLDEIWKDRPGLPSNPLFMLAPVYSGRTTEQKLEWLRKDMKSTGADYFLMNSLDQIAWLFNIRCHDIPYNPVAISYALIGSESAILFISQEKVGKTVKENLNVQGISIAPYESIFRALEALPGDSTIMLDGNTLNYALFSHVQQQPGKSLVDRPSPVALEKALKNPVEIEGYRKAYLNDGIALTRFFIWIEQMLALGTPVSELDTENKLSSLRGEAEGAMGDGFHYTSAYGKNAALPHYSASPAQFSMLEPKGFYLIDSGGHYLYGTTDITRTVPLGPLTPMEKEDYTLVLKGMIALSTAVFMKGTTGTHLDIIPRMPLWKGLRNYGHGTGHGIGHYLCVHEGPQDIRLTFRDQTIVPGMVTSNEPGMYREGEHGVRHENVLLCKDLGTNEFGEWYGFETLTICYIDTSAITLSLMDPWEVDWLNDYNRMVYKNLAPHLDPDEAQWLAAKTAEIKTLNLPAQR